MATIPFSVQASRSILSYPAPARTITFRFLAASSTSRVALSERIIIPSTSATAAINSALSVYDSSKASSYPAPSTTSRIAFTAAGAKGLSVAIKTLVILLILNVKNKMSLPAKSK